MINSVCIKCTKHAKCELWYEIFTTCYLIFFLIVLQVQNVVGFTLCLTQLSLFAIYPSKSKSDAKDEKKELWKIYYYYYYC